MRAFVGLLLPDAALDALERVQEGLTVGRQVPAESMHLTLAFLDNQPEDALQTLHQLMAEISVPPLQLTFRGLDTFGGKLPRVLAAQVQKTRELTRLRDHVRSACRTAGIELSRERFRPHVTLARFSRHLEVSQVKKIARYLSAASEFRLECEADSFVLFQSTLAPEGARYDILAEYPLEG
ncbi:RNA 2',3'-cyclic phosphodiesterase [Leisingera sp. ANG-M7]|uniref:RNA 2',3'-cyclic phosphodiesterase n=1 Tax=Leisingera sp. ANG-M7 TaxID=1577902 RepID=UPI00069168D1|nr:RNA 2',3'-cyclic phosphodiesterase [Leisingera sp. ANG-M7]